MMAAAESEQGSIPSAQFWDAHVEPMRDSVCEALTGSKPQYLVASLSGGNAVLQWDAPTYDTVSLTGYRILRGGNSASLDGAGRRHADYGQHVDRPEPNV